MQSGKFSYRIIACAIVLLFSLVTMSVAADMGQTLNEACAQCHSTKRICLNLGVKSLAGWKATLSKMVEEGAHLSAGSIDEAAAYLVALAPGAGPLCQ